MDDAVLTQPIIPNSSWRNKVEELSRQKISACFQCEKCTNGCPVTFAMDTVPDKLIHAIHLGLKDKVLQSDTIWVCASCETCTARCPNGIDIAHVMDTLRQMSVHEGVSSQKDTSVFHSAFLSSVKRYGRIHELEMMVSYTLKSEGPGGLLKQAGLGINMFMKGKLKLLPRSLRAAGGVRNIFKQTEGMK